MVARCRGICGWCLADGAQNQPTLDSLFYPRLGDRRRIHSHHSLCSGINDRDASCSVVVRNLVWGQIHGLAIYFVWRDSYWAPHLRIMAFRYVGLWTAAFAREAQCGKIV